MFSKIDFQLKNRFFQVHFFSKKKVPENFQFFLGFFRFCFRSQKNIFRSRKKNRSFGFPLFRAPSPFFSNSPDKNGPAHPFSCRLAQSSLIFTLKSDVYPTFRPITSCSFSRFFSPKFTKNSKEI